jgi:hypothetical protein
MSRCTVQCSAARQCSATVQRDSAVQCSAVQCSVHFLSLSTAGAFLLTGGRGVMLSWDWAALANSGQVEGQVEG